jgi:hypothetical protein
VHASVACNLLFVFGFGFSSLLLENDVVVVEPKSMVSIDLSVQYSSNEVSGPSLHFYENNLIVKGRK